MLNRLRDYFDDPLFIRAPHGIVPTTRAEELAAPVAHLADIDLLLQPVAFDPRQATLTLHACCRRLRAPRDRGAVYRGTEGASTGNTRAGYTCRFRAHDEPA